MKKITLVLAAVVMLAGGAFAEGKSCCKKKGEKCGKETAACCKDKKHGKKSCDKDAAAKEEKGAKEAPKANS
ncbi:MAG: hypothetical protein K9G49_12295 [Taibaiella sp.]|nr:hypothetical protein [Taibaiella sp.]